MRAFCAVLGVVAATTLLAGCGDPTAPPASDGPAASGPPVRSATAELECEGPPYERGAGDYVDSGLERVGDDPASALEDLLEQNDPGLVPHDGYEEVRRVDDRVLLAYTVDGQVKAAFVAVDGVEDWDGGRGWGVDSWAVCDPAELPASVTDDWWIEVWTDKQAHRVPVTDVYSYDGSEHCDWQDIVFLTMGKETYLRDTEGELAAQTRGRFQGESRLPADAASTGWRHDGRELWTVDSGDAAYLVSLDDPDDVESWPRAQDFGCA